MTFSYDPESNCSPNGTFFLWSLSLKMSSSSLSLTWKTYTKMMTLEKCRMCLPLKNVSVNHVWLVKKKESENPFIVARAGKHISHKKRPFFSVFLRLFLYKLGWMNDLRDGGRERKRMWHSPQKVIYRRQSRTNMDKESNGTQNQDDETL